MACLKKILIMRSFHQAGVSWRQVNQILTVVNAGGRETEMIWITSIQTGFLTDK